MCYVNEREVKLSVPYHFITAALIPSLSKYIRTGTPPRHKKANDQRIELSTMDKEKSKGYRLCGDWAKEETSYPFRRINIIIELPRV